MQVEATRETTDCHFITIAKGRCHMPSVYKPRGKRDETRFNDKGFVAVQAKACDCHHLTLLLIKPFDLDAYDLSVMNSNSAKGLLLMANLSRNASDALTEDKDSSRRSMDDVSRQAFKEEKRRIASQKKAAQATSTNKLSTDRPSISTDRPSVSTDRPFVSTDRPSVIIASTP
ncbi:hypothetical protein Tco_0813901 [Tanacetum coccineum]